MMNSSPVSLKLNETEDEDEPRKSYGKLALLLALLAIVLGVALGYVYRSLRRLEREVAQLSQQTQTLSRQVAEVEAQSQTSAQQASQAAANAQAAAHERDLERLAESNSDAQAQLARQQAADAQQQAEQAKQQAEQMRKEREAELQQLQQALGQIAETHRTAMGLVMTLDNNSIRFDFDKADIKPQYRDTLNRIAGILMTLKGFTVAVYGYTDDIGNEKYNLQLSQRRAEAVRDVLVKAGISKGIITAKGFGKSDPRVKGDSEKARAANRRVEIGIVDTKLITDGALAVPNN